MLEPQFLDVLTSAIVPQIQKAIRDINDVNSTDDALWEKLVLAGLTDKSLKLKITELAHWFTKKKIWKGIKLLNTILGSLGWAIPGLEPVKEFKDFLEERLDDEEAEDDEPDGDLAEVIRRARQRMLSAFD